MPSASAPVTLDIDATLIEVHSENKQGTAAHYKGGFGFHPLLCFSDDGDALAALLRPGNAAANSIADHIELLDAAIGQLPAAVGAGHHVGDDAADAARPLRVRADSAGCSVHIAQACRDRNVGFSLVARANDAIDAAIAVALADADRWQGAIRQNGDSRRGAAVADLTDLVDTDDWPPGTRLIVRREPRHAGAQRSLFPSDAYRYWGHWTDHAGGAVALDAHMRTSKAALQQPHRQRVALVCWAHNLPAATKLLNTPPEGTKTSQPPPQTIRRAHLTRPHTNHKPETTPQQPPTPNQTTPPAPNTHPKDPSPQIGMLFVPPRQFVACREHAAHGGSSIPVGSLAPVGRAGGTGTLMAPPQRGERSAVLTAGVAPGSRLSWTHSPLIAEEPVWYRTTPR